jgi:hypothetical protein
MADKKQSWLQEHAIYNVDTLITEDNEGKKKYIMKGEFGRVKLPNKNGRVYTEEVMKAAINENSEIIESRRMMGELDHPPTPKVNLKEVSHVVTKLELQEDGSVYGEAEVLPTPNGEILKSLIESGIKLGISSRGYGKVLRKGDLLEVAPGYKMITFDIVADPSSQKAFPEPVYEDVELGPEPTGITVSDIFNEVFSEEDTQEEV